MSAAAQPVTATSAGPAETIKAECRHPRAQAVGVAHEAAPAKPEERVMSDVRVQGICPHCRHDVSVLLPVEPLFQREEVCALVPIKLSTLRS